MPQQSLDGTVLRVLASLSRSGDDDLADVLDPSRGGRPLVWLGSAIGSRFPDAPSWANPWAAAAAGLGLIPISANPVDRAAKATLKRLAALDALHREERMLRLGWVWVVGTLELDDEVRQLRHPLVSLPVRCEAVSNPVLVAAGDVELSPLVPDHLVAGFEASIPDVDLQGWEITSRSLKRFPTLVAWVREVTASIGLHDVELTGADPRLAAPPSGRSTASVGYGVYQSRDVSGTSLATVLRNWAGRGIAEGTAFSAVLGSAAGTADPAPREIPAPVDVGKDAEAPPVRLTRGQLEAVRRSRHAPVTVISGAPGSGKTHAACAVALDAVARGDHVLVATQTVHASEVLTAMIESMPGPEPVVFGGNEATGRLRTKLADGLDDEVPASKVEALEREVAAATDELDRIRTAIGDILAAEASAARVRDEAWQAMSPVRRLAAPGAFDSDLTDGDLRDLAELAATAQQTGGGWWRRRRTRRAGRSLRSAVGASDATSLEAVVDAVTAAGELRASARLAGAGGTRVGALWVGLEAAEARLTQLRGDLLVARCSSGPARGPPHAGPHTSWPWPCAVAA